MPCRSDYMDPTEREINRGNEIVVELNQLADRLTHANDVLRDHVLYGNQSILPLVNQNAYYIQTLKKIRDKDKNLYALAKPKRLPGLFEHVENLLYDYTRLNNFVTRAKVMTVEDYHWVKSEQEAHREDDLSRLMKVFGASGDRKRLAAVLAADPTKPLEPQLGFSPDDF